MTDIDFRIRYGGRKKTKRWIEKEEGGYWKTERGRPKNTLATIRAGDIIFFGIARFDARYGLPFEKSVGTHIARGRAEKATQSAPVAYVKTVDGIIYGESEKNGQRVPGLFGCCNIDSIKMLLEYFENIDTLMPQDKLLYDAKHTAIAMAGIVNAQELGEDYVPVIMDRDPPSMEVDTERMQQLAGVK